MYGKQARLQDNQLNFSLSKGSSVNSEKCRKMDWMIQKNNMDSRKENGQQMQLN